MRRPVLFMSLCATGLAAIGACSDLRSANVPGEEPSLDGGRAPTNEPEEPGLPDEERRDAKAPSRVDAGRTCPVPADRPEALSYVTTEDTVFDAVTNLMWERTYRGEGIPSFAEAEDICSKLTTADHADWRLPTRAELLGILDYAQGAPKISREIFTKTVPDLTWTSSRYGERSNDVWLIDFFSGTSIHFDGVEEEDGGTPVPVTVRCVRTVDPPCAADPRFVSDGSVVRDRVNGLEWSTEEGSPRGPSEAVDYCKSLDGVADRPWRVPSIKESDSVVTGSEADGYVTPVFSSSTWTQFWTSTRSSFGGLESKYILDTSKGNIQERIESAKPFAVRCVR